MFLQMFSKIQLDAKLHLPFSLYILSFLIHLFFHIYPIFVTSTLSSHFFFPCFAPLLRNADMLRARQEALAAAVRNPVALEAHLPSAGSSSSSSQRRKQGLPQHRDAHYTDR